MVILQEACASLAENEFKYFTTGASKSIFPFSASCIMARPVKDLLTEPKIKGVCGVTVSFLPSTP